MGNYELDEAVAVVYAINDEYAPYLFVSLMSLKKFSAADVIYHIYVLYSDLAGKNRERIEGLSNHHIRIKCIDVKGYTQGAKITGSLHLSVETYYRVLVADLFPQYRRMVYVDSDTLILADIAELYHSNLHDKAVGAIRDVVCDFLVEYYQKMDLGMDVCTCFNAGVLVIDLKKFSEKKIREKCLDALEKDSKSEKRKFLYMDQDVLNLFLKGDICFLDSTWNVQWQYLWRPYSVYPEYREKYLKDSREAKILHYAGDKKPWRYPELEKADLFWETARNTVFYEEILFRNLGCRQENNIFKSYLFPFSRIPQGSRIVLYGAGEVGKTFYRQNREIHYVDIVLWVDKNNRKQKQTLAAVYGIDDFLSYPPVYDYILIAINDGKICGEVRNWMTEQGIPEEKIVWESYGRELS